MPLEFRLPDIGEGLTEAEIVEWLVAVGDDVRANQPVVVIETAKTTVEIPAPSAGVILNISGNPGDTVAVGEVMFVVGGATVDGQQTGDDKVQTLDADHQPKRDSVKNDLSSVIRQPSAGDRSNEVRAMPIVRKLARDRGIDLANVAGSGSDGAVTREDLDAHEPSAAASVELTPLSSTRRAIAVHMTQSWTTIPHVTVQAEIRAERLLDDRGIRESTSLPLEPLVAQAVMPLLRDYPDFNAEYRDESVAYRDRINMGFAVDTDEGLMVVVVREADELSLTELADEFERLAAAAIARTANPEDLVGQTFTISNIGALGGGHGTPLIPVGTSAILSVGRALEQPVVDAGELGIGLVAPIDLSYDHRLIDGGRGQRFLSALVARLEAGLQPDNG